MTALPKNLPPIKTVNKQELIDALDTWFKEAGITYDPNVTAQQVREMMIADGVKPAENSSSRELLRMRYPEDYYEDES